MNLKYSQKITAFDAARNQVPALNAQSSVMGRAGLGDETREYISFRVRESACKAPQAASRHLPLELNRLKERANFGQASTELARRNWIGAPFSAMSFWAEADRYQGSHRACTWTSPYCLALQSVLKNERGPSRRCTPARLAKDLRVGAPPLEPPFADWLASIMLLGELETFSVDAKR
jgi:hypothetical protein